MPWHTPSRGLVRPSTDRIAAAAFEKLEDRVAVAATATLAGTGLIFDGMPQLIVPNEPPPLARPNSGRGHTGSPETSHPQPHHKKHHGGGGGGHHGAPSQQGHKKQNENSSGGVKRV